MRRHLDLSRKFSKRQEEFEPIRDVFVGLIGDGTGEDPWDTGDPNYLYVRSEGRGVMPGVYDPIYAQRNNIPVYVGVTGENEDEFVILGIATQYIDGLGDYSYLIHHHKAHQFRDPDGGDDTVWCQKQQGVYLLAAPTDPLSMQVYVHRDFYLYRDEFKLWGGGLSPDFSPYLPSGSYGRYVLLTVDQSTNLLYTTPGDMFPTVPPTSPATNIPQLPLEHTPVAAIYLTEGLTEIDWDQIFDVRLIVGAGYNIWGATTTGDPYEILVTNASGSAIAWKEFDWEWFNNHPSADMVHDHSTDGLGGRSLNTILQIDVGETVYIVDGGGVISGVGNYVVVITDDPLLSRNLNTISAEIGVFKYLFGHNSLHAGRTVTVKHGTGNLELKNGADMVLAGPDDAILLFYREDSGHWVEFSRTDLSSTDHTHSAVGDGGILLPNVTCLGGTDTALVYQITGGYMQEDPTQLWYDYPTGIFHASQVEIGGTGGYMRVEAHGDTWWERGGGLCYGSLYLHDGAVNIDISTVGQGTFVKVTGLTTGLTNRVSVVSSAFRVEKIGTYKVDWQISGDAQANNINYKCAIFVNGAEQNDGSGRTQSRAAGLYFTMSGTGLIDVTNTTHDIDLRIKEPGAGAGTDVDLSDVNFNLMQIGGT